MKTTTKPKKCKHCGEVFTPSKPMQKACSIPCAIALVDQANAKKIAKAKAQEQEAAANAAKAAQASLCRTLALELAPRGIRANVVVPGVVPTDMTRAPRDGADVEAQLEGLRRLHPLGRLGTPADVGQAVAFLLHAEWITGAALAVDGGLLVG
jgi:NAD(P)-dependent dehydrogenase (short-subunit alcohol dehydrogenase family)